MPATIVFGSLHGPSAPAASNAARGIDSVGSRASGALRSPGGNSTAVGSHNAVRVQGKFGAGCDLTEVTLASGPGALGLTQISEIVNKPDAEFVASLPDEIQNYTGISAGIPTGPTQSEAVAAFVAFLKNGEAMKIAGMQVD